MTARSLTVAAHEIAKFSRARNNWWTPNGALSSLHQFNPVRVKFICESIREFWKPDPSYIDATQDSPPFRWGMQGNPQILDVGCGGGILSESLARLGGVVTGIDACTESIEAARKRLISIDDSSNPWKEKLFFEDVDLFDVIERKNHFDCVVAIEVIEHVEDARSFLEGLCALTKPGGLLILSTMDKSLKTALSHILIGEYVSGVIPRGTHDWSKFIPPKDVSRFASRYGVHEAHLKYILTLPDVYQSIVSRKMQVKFSLSEIINTGHYFWAGVKAAGNKKDENS